MNDFFKDENGRPILLLGLQAHNSSTGTDMIQKTIHAISLYGGNLLEAPIYWNRIEAEQDVYDMTLLKNLIDETRKAGLKLIILWFATSKNGHPNYAPDYIKLQPEIYRIAIGPDKAPVASLSPHCMATLERDRKAFEKVLAFLKEYDEKEKTVIAVQIENEMGFANTDRDYSQMAQEDYIKPVPQVLHKVVLEDTGLEGMRPEQLELSTWRGCFGRHAHEAFSAWYHACFINQIAEAGKRIYDIPMITNVMIGEQGYEEAGRCYNSGAAVGRVLDIWKFGAPSLDLICPDIYNQAKSEYTRICSRYDRPDNALFIPESPIAGEANAINSLLAIAEHGAIGVCCFGAESALHNDGSLLEEARTMAISMKTISSLAPLIINYRGKGAVHALVQEEFAAKQYIKLPRYHIEAHFINKKGHGWGNGSSINMRAEENKWNLAERGRGILIQTADDEFYLAGAGVAVDFIRRPDPLDENPYIHLSSRQSGQLNFLSVEEGHFEGDMWVTDYVRNGDESNFSLYVHGGQAVRIRINPNIGMDLE
jgi:beta-galactosidase GanA